jgi:hypothetical protein
MPNEPSELSPEEQRREAAERAVKANETRNADRLARMDQIANSAEEARDPSEMVEVTDEMFDDRELPEEKQQARQAVKQAVKDEPQNDQQQERQDDEAREAGADDVREVNGIKEYRLLVNGEERWRTLAQIRADAQKVESADQYLQTAADTVRKATRPVEPSQEEVARKTAERRTRVKELLKRQALGDEQAIEELAELIDATPSAVTPDVLRALDERFDSRVTFREAVAQFEEEYAPELKHPAMKSYAGQLDAALAAQEPNLSPRERLRRVGEQIRRELKETYGLSRAGNTGPSDKALRKAGGPRPLPQAGARQPTGESEEESEDTQSVIQKIAQGRNQPRAVVHGPTRGR